MKDIKSIQIVPYTLMMSSISAILAVLFAIIFIIIFGVAGSLIPGFNGGMIATIAIAILLIFPVGSFLLSITESFLTALLYNLLVSRIGAIKIGIDNLKEIKNVPVVPFALMSAAIGGIFIFLIMLIIGPLVTIGLQGAALAASTTGASIPGFSSIGALGIVGLFLMVIGVPIAMFILIFIATAIMTFLYNLLAPKIGGIQLNFGNAVGNLFEIEFIPVVAFAIILTLVMALFNLITQIISLIGSVAVGSSLTTQLIALFVNVVINVIFGFIIYALTAIIYNYLRPKIGGIKLEIE